jgi:hypothetical protein
MTFIMAVFALIGLAGCGEKTTTIEPAKNPEQEAIVVPDTKGDERSGVGRTPTVDE